MQRPLPDVSAAKSLLRINMTSLAGPDSATERHSIVLPSVDDLFCHTGLAATVQSVLPRIRPILCLGMQFWGVSHPTTTRQWTDLPVLDRRFVESLTRAISTAIGNGCRQYKTWIRRCTHPCASLRRWPSNSQVIISQSGTIKEVCNAHEGLPHCGSQLPWLLRRLLKLTFCGTYCRCWSPTVIPLRST